MGSVKVTVYGRIKPCLKSPMEYKIKYGDDEDQINFVTPRAPTKRTFRFKKIFGEDATQEQIFETVAKPVIKNLFSGYNGTIFTYGQTGSGKTYTMTGDIENWANTGLIPRVIQEIFKVKTQETIITITFCEIYNEHIYDLIRNDLPDTDPTSLNIVTDTNYGITNFRNLSSHKVTSAEEAIQLFMRGDSNKMVAETGSNFRSSRSHAIFSMSLEFQHPTQENLRMKPVFYLVDLAGSERLSKCKTPLSNVSETRYINLSLHYLEQVLLALRQPGRAHIPYRNSLMTALLKNSLGGNSITIMIATLSVFKEDAEETTQTCRFAERVALIKNEVKLIELSNPEKEIDYLRKENERLKAQLKIFCNDQNNLSFEKLDETEKEKCIESVRNFIQDNDYFDLPLTNVRRMEFCFKVMRDEILKERELNECKETKSKENQIDFVKDVPNAESNKSLKNIRSIRSIKSEKSFDCVKSLSILKASDDDWSVQMNKITTKPSSTQKLMSAMDIPKVNIVFDEQVSDKENDSSQTIKDLKDRLSKIKNPKEEKPILKSPNHSAQNFLQTKPYNSLTEWLTEKFRETEKSLERNVNLSTSKCKVESKTKNNDSINTVGNVFSSKKILTPSTNDEIQENIRESLLGETFQAKNKKSTEKEVAGFSEKISRVSNTNDFMSFTSKCVPLTGDKEVDDEIINFYKTRYQLFKNK